MRPARAIATRTLTARTVSAWATMITGRPMAAVTRTVAVGTVGVAATDVMVMPARAAVTRLGAQGRAAFRCDEEAVGSTCLRHALLGGRQ